MSLKPPQETEKSLWLSLKLANFTPFLLYKQYTIWWQFPVWLEFSWFSNSRLTSLRWVNVISCITVFTFSAAGTFFMLVDQLTNLWIRALYLWDKVHFFTNRSVRLEALEIAQVTVQVFHLSQNCFMHTETDLHPTAFWKWFLVSQ